MRQDYIILEFYNNFIHQDRKILIHNGNTPKHSDGCLLINQNLTFKDKAQTIEVDNILQVGKKDILAEHIKDKFKSYLFGNNSNQSIKDIMQQIEVRIENNFQPKILNKTTEQELPPNVIRIETLDESEEFIEIILPPTLEINDPPLQDASAMFIPTFKGIGSAIKGAKNVIKGAKFARSLTRQEVLEIVDKLKKVFNRKGKDTGIRLVKSKKELDELWERLTKNAKELEPDVDKRHGKPIYKRQLDDGTNINYRVDSKTRGETIDINSRSPKTNIKIHINKGM